MKGEHGMSYSVFRVQGVKNTGALVGLGKHNKDRISHTNLDIDKSKSCENIELIRCEGTYNQKFNEITKELRKNHDERMKSMRADRVKTFERSINDSKTDVACEMLFTSDESFFKDMSREDITKWAKESLEFVIKAIGIPKKHIIHATVHMDEKTPHLHVVAVPIAKVYDGRVKQEVLKISRAKFIGGKMHLSKLQDAYNERMNDNGFKLERGVVGANKTHKKTVTYKKEQLAKLEKQIKKADKVLDRQQEIISGSFVMAEKIDGIEVKPYFFDRDKVIIDSKDFDFLKEKSKGAVAIKGKFEDLERKYNNQGDNLRSLNSELLGYADKVDNLKKGLEVKDKKIGVLSKKLSVLVEVCKEHNPELIDKANEKLRESNRPKPKIMNRGCDMER